MLRLILSLPCPLNRLYRAMPFRAKNGYMISRQVLSREARLRRDRIIAEIITQRGGSRVPFDGAVQVQITVVPRNHQTADNDAYIKQLFDCLEHAGVLRNDNQIIAHSVERVEPQHPGRIICEVWEVGG